MPKLATKRLHMVCSTNMVFCIDCSIPITKVIDYIKKNIIDLLVFFESYDADEEREASIKWQAKIMWYSKYHTDDDFLMYNNPFVSSIDEIKKQLEEIIKTYNNPKDEVITSFKAIWLALNKAEWPDTNSKKLIFVFTDAQSKQSGNTNQTGVIGIDNWDIIKCLAKDIDQNGISLFFYGLENDTNKIICQIPRTTTYLFKDNIDFCVHTEIINNKDILNQMIHHC